MMAVLKILNLCAEWNHAVNRQQLQGEYQKSSLSQICYRPGAVNLITAKIKPWEVKHT